MDENSSLQERMTDDGVTDALGGENALCELQAQRGRRLKLRDLRSEARRCSGWRGMSALGAGII